MTPQDVGPVSRGCRQIGWDDVTLRDHILPVLAGTSIRVTIYYEGTEQEPQHYA